MRYISITLFILWRKLWYNSPCRGEYIIILFILYSHTKPTLPWERNILLFIIIISSSHIRLTLPWNLPTLPWTDGWIYLTIILLRVCARARVYPSESTAGRLQSERGPDIYIFVIIIIFPHQFFPWSKTHPAMNHLLLFIYFILDGLHDNRAGFESDGRACPLSPVHVYKPTLGARNYLLSIIFCCANSPCHGK